ALPLASIDDLVAWAEPRLLDAIAAELHARRSPAAEAALLGLASNAHPRVRALQIDAAARGLANNTHAAGGVSLTDAVDRGLAGDGDPAASAIRGDAADRGLASDANADGTARSGEGARSRVIERGLVDPHHGPRAVAVWWWRRFGGSVASALDDRDPAVREA